jgi:hypothetical protein
MIGPISRILLRYGAGGLVVAGLLGSDLGDQIAADEDILHLVQIGVGAAIGAGTELWYWAANKYGWSK